MNPHGSILQMFCKSDMPPLAYHISTSKFQCFHQSCSQVPVVELVSGAAVLTLINEAQVC